MESLNSQENHKELISTILEGFEQIFKPKKVGNPYVLEKVYEKEKPFYDSKPFNAKPEPHLRDEEIQVIKDVCHKFNITADIIKDDYLLYNQNLTVGQYLDKISKATEWTTRAYYNNLEDEFYVKEKKEYANSSQNQYGDSNIPSG